MPRMVECSSCGRSYNADATVGCPLCGEGWQDGSLREESVSPSGLHIVTTESIPGFRVDRMVGGVFATASTNWQAGSTKKGIWNNQESRMEWAVQTALARMGKKAESMGADAIVGTTVAVNESEGSNLSFRSTGAVVMGTAVTLKVLEQTSEQAL